MRMSKIVMLFLLLLARMHRLFKEYKLQQKLLRVVVEVVAEVVEEVILMMNAVQEAVLAALVGLVVLSAALEMQNIMPG